MLSYRHLLWDELHSRRTRDPAYSLRALAQNLGISPAYLSEIMNGRKMLAERKALSLTERLEWPERKRRLFLTLLRYEAAPDGVNKRELLEEAELLFRSRATLQSLSQDLFRVISKWYHYAILELTELGPFISEPAWIATRLGIPRHDVEEAIIRLRRVGLLLERKGKLSKSLPSYSTNTVPTSAVRSFHLQMLEKAKRAITERPESSSTVFGVTVAIDPDRLAEANERIAKFRQELMTLFGGGERRAVYHFALQLFRVDKERPSNPIP